MLDANCFIDANNEFSAVHESVKRIFELASEGKIKIAVSFHTLNELEKKPDEALKLAQTCQIAKHWPIGSWDDQVCTWNQVEGTWDEARWNNEIQLQIETLAKRGNSIRDRGAFLDALQGRYNGFVTSDRQMVDDKPKKEINSRFFTKIMRPQEVIAEFA